MFVGEKHPELQSYLKEYSAKNLFFWQFQKLSNKALVLKGGSEMAAAVRLDLIQWTWMETQFELKQKTLKCP